MKHRLCTLLVLTLACSASAATRNNDDSCDIAVLPAATLLLPYFEVDLDDPSGETTIFTITNVGNLDRIARVTLWTDRAYPVITFDVYLTGYDVQALNLYDIIERGVIAPDAGTGTAITKRGTFSDRNSRLDLSGCARLGGTVDESVLLRMQSAFTEGSILGDCTDIGGEHANAVGYATIDVVGNCSSTTPTEPSYWTTDIRYDNVLVGDYRQVDNTRNLAQGGPLVHIRAVPEGGTPSERRASSSIYDAGFRRTFYARYQSTIAPDLDGRQPLPSQFATRWIQGGSGDYETSLKIWREGRTGGDATCGEYASEDALAVREIVVFDEQENSVGSSERIELAAVSRTGVDESEVFPQLANGVTSGWIYLNLDRSGRDELASQAWVISSMRAQSTYSTDIDGIALGNGCSAPAEKSEISLARGGVIAPASNESHAHGRVATTNNDDSCDIALLPAATLLLPYFEVEFGPPSGPPDAPPPPPTNRDPTLFTVTNVSPNDQIARVTLWTDYAFPVLTFNIFLTGYDVQSINLEDIIRHGVIAPDEGTGTRVSERGAWSDRNRALDTSACGQLSGRLPQAYVERMQSAFIRGKVPDMGDLHGCDSIGEEHVNAIGYATIDVVRNCSTNTPFSDEYWTNDLAWDNVLIGDYQHVDPYNGSAGGGPMVHIRAVPEGGTSTDRRTLPRKYDAGFERTFYARYQPVHAPRFDGRQPLPSVFAARWIDDMRSTRTTLQIWREGRPGRLVNCNDTERVTCGPNVAEIVSLDESENAVGYIQVSRIGTCSLADDRLDLPMTSRTSVRDTSVFQVLGNGAVSGWIYLNLDNTTGDAPLPSSNWVISSITTDGRYAVDIDAAALGNGCSLEQPVSEVTSGSQIIGPLLNENP